MNRRESLKFSSNAVDGISSNSPAIGQILGSIPGAEQNFIPVAGIFPNPNSIKELGVHLRWWLPPSKGIPDSILIYKKLALEKESNIFIRPADSNRQTLPEQWNHLKFEGGLNKFRLSETSNGRCYEKGLNNASRPLKIIFSSEVDFCTIQLEIINPLIAKAFHQDGSILQEVKVENVQAYSSISFRSLNSRKIKYVEIPTNFKFLHFITFNGNQYLCDAPDWIPIGTIDNKKDIDDQSLFRRLSADTRNFFITSNSDITNYELTAIKYTGLLKAIREPSEKYFLSDSSYNSITDIPPDKLILKPKKASSAKINAWNLLILESIDPNNARMLGLYFVDTTVKGENEIHDYKIEALYTIKAKKITICGVVQKVGGKYSALPNLKDKLDLAQTAKTWWEFDKDFNEFHFGKVKLSWPVPEQNADNELWKRFIQPVIYALRTDSNKPRLIVPQLDKKLLYFLDQRVTVKQENINYTLSGVDIFGQESKPVENKIKLTDKDTPPAPVKLSFITINEKIFLQYEYGGYQYLTGPQTKNFFIYQKNDSLYSQNKKVKYSSSSILGNNVQGFSIIRINLIEAINPVFYKHLHFIESYTGKKLPAAKRKKFRITEATSNSITFVSTSPFAPEEKGTVLLEAEATDKSMGWINIITGQPNERLLSGLINYRHFIEGSSDPEHFSGTVLNDNNCLHAVATKSYKKRKSDHKDLFEDEQSATFPEEYTEVLINRTISDADIFTGGSLKIGNSSYIIVAQSAGSANATNEQLQVKVLIDAYIDVNEGLPVLLRLPIRPNNPDSEFINDWIIFRLQNNNKLKGKTNGEILLRGTKKYKTDGQQHLERIPVVAQVFSDFYSITELEVLEVLVRLAKRTSYLHDEKIITLEQGISNRILYFEPYRTDLSQWINSIPFASNGAYKTTHFAAEAVDDMGNRSPLSLIAQFIKTRNKTDKPLAPGKPYPCDEEDEESAIQGYLKPPNSEGRSTFCLQWDINNQAANNHHLRYEVGRALDKTIIAVHKDKWLKGQTNEFLEAGTSITGTLLSVSPLNSKTGLISISFNNNQSIDAAVYKGGRLIQRTDDSSMAFEIVSITKTVNNVNVTLRPLCKGKTPTNNESFTIDKLPDYKSIHDDEVRLKAMADNANCSSAFSIVTGQPLRNNNQFLDDVPGLGYSRYFYKVKAVDASENRSEWSEVSVPIYQIDTSPPDKVLEFAGNSINNKALLFWKKPIGNIVEYILTRKQKSNGDIVTSRLQINNLMDKPLHLLNAETLILSMPLVFNLPESIIKKEQASAFLDEQLSVFEVIGTSKTLIPNKQYNLIRSYDPRGNKITLNQIILTKKRDAGSMFEIRWQDIIYNKELGYLYFIDDSVLENEIYVYELTPVKETGPLSNQLKIVGVSSLTKELEIKNFSKPDGITINYTFLTLANVEVSEFIPEARVRITINKPPINMFVNIQKRTSDQAKKIFYTDYTSEEDNRLYNGWIEIAANKTTISLIDNEINITDNFEYFLEFKSKLEVFSEPLVLSF